MRDRSEAYPRALGLLALVLALLLALLLASSPAGAASAKLSAQPLSADFLKYQAEQRQRQALGLDRVPWSRLGLIPAPMDPPKAHGGALLEAETTYPASFDLRAAGKVSPVKDQDPYGACWTFATFASAESCLLPGELRDFSEDNMVLNCGFDARQRSVRLTAAPTANRPPTWCAGADPLTRVTMPTAMRTRRPGLSAQEARAGGPVCGAAERAARTRPASRPR